MELLFYPYDFTYKTENEKTFIYLYGKTKDNQKICVIKEHVPFFYAEKLEACKEGRLKCIDGWFNVYEKYEHADFHTHPGNVLSCVYFLNCEENTGAKLLFKSGRSGKSYVEDSLVSHNPFPGKLVIFSSYLDHAVQQHNTDNLRITLAYNYREI